MEQSWSFLMENLLDTDHWRFTTSKELDQMIHETPYKSTDWFNSIKHWDGTTLEDLTLPHKIWPFKENEQIMKWNWVSRPTSCSAISGNKRCSIKQKIMQCCILQIYLFLNTQTWSHSGGGGCCKNSRHLSYITQEGLSPTSFNFAKSSMALAKSHCMYKCQAVWYCCTNERCPTEECSIGPRASKICTGVGIPTTETLSSCVESARAWHCRIPFSPTRTPYSPDMSLPWGWCSRHSTSSNFQLEMPSSLFLRWHHTKACMLLLWCQPLCFRYWFQFRHGLPCLWTWSFSFSPLSPRMLLQHPLLSLGTGQEYHPTCLQSSDTVTNPQKFVDKSLMLSDDRPH